jgi:hypothetical protein
MIVERFLVLILLGIFLSVGGWAEDLERNWWWDVTIEISVKGEYVCGIDEGEGDVEGQYSFVVASVSGMERDNGDYLLYPGESRILSLDWVESRGGRVSNVGHLVKPRLLVNYVLRESGRVVFDLEMKSLWLEMERGAVCRHLLLPRSRENRLLHPKDHYNRDVREGSNQVRIKDKPLYKRDETEAASRWRWRRSGAEGRHEHTVECKVSVKRRLKQ